MLSDKPRTGKYADKRGSYEQVLRVKTAVIKPGEPIQIEQFFTGYGEIKSSKVIFYPSDSIIDLKGSYMVADLKWTPDENDPDGGKYIQFGGEKIDITSDNGMQFVLQGIKKDVWEESTLFVDVRQDDFPPLFTEGSRGGFAPFTYYLKTVDNIRPGKHVLDFYFIYYNGENWEKSNKSVEIKVQNIIERHEIFIWYLALITTVFALLSTAIVPFVRWAISISCN